MEVGTMAATANVGRITRVRPVETEEKLEPMAAYHSSLLDELPGLAIGLVTLVYIAASLVALI
jgi:hypothetical protein